MDIVINASPLILLEKIGRLHLLNDLFGTVYVPCAVIEEVSAGENVDAKQILSHVMYQKLRVANRIAVLGLVGRLHIGEVEVMIGAIENGISYVALDDNAARNKAKQLGLDVTGTLGILLKANANGLIADLGQEINNLRRSGMYLSDDIVKKVMPYQ